MKEFDDLCKKCMSQLNGKCICDNCGADQNFEQKFPALNIGEMLEQRYLIGKKLYEGNCEFCYVAYDVVMKSPVYIKEFYPLDLCKRNLNGSDLEVFESRVSEFVFLKNEFLKYYRSIAKLRSLSAIVPIYNIFTENNTAYVVLEFEEGLTLEEFVAKNGGYISWDTARHLFMPVLSALSEMNSMGVLHLSLTPKNLIINNNSKMKITGFCIPQTKIQTSFVTPSLNEGYSALEQYEPNGEVNSSTDVYGFTACLFYALTGTQLKAANKRKTDDRLLIKTDILETIPSNVVSAISDGLQVYARDRIRSFEGLRDKISCVSILKEEAQNYVGESQGNNNEIYDDLNTRKSNFVALVISGIIAFIILVAIGAFWLFGGDFSLSSNQYDSSEESSQISQSSNSSSNQSSESNLVSVPNVVGKKYEEVKKQAGIDGSYEILLLSEEFSDSVEEGYIISQTPQKGQKIEKGSAIVVTVSKGIKSRALPQIEGLSLSDASIKLTESGFIPVKTESFSSKIQEGYVIGYDGHKAGDMLDYGKEVKIIVSKGAQ